MEVFVKGVCKFFCESCMEVFFVKGVWKFFVKDIWKFLLFLCVVSYFNTYVLERCLMHVPLLTQENIVLLRCFLCYLLH